jgi:hypothetical protein
MYNVTVPQFSTNPDALIVSYKDAEHLPVRRQHLYDTPIALRPEYAPDIRTIRYTARPPGRNDSCPCGSMIKFKRCHGRPLYNPQYDAIIDYEQNLPRRTRSKDNPVG